MIKQFLIKNRDELEDAVKSYGKKISDICADLEKNKILLDTMMEQVDYRIETFSPIFNSSPEMIKVNDMKEKINEEQLKLEQYEKIKTFLEKKKREFEEVLAYYVSRET